MALNQKGTQKHRRRPIVAPVHHSDTSAFVPCHQLPETGLGGSTTYELLTNELLLDGQARLNLATFVTTWMPSTAAKLMSEVADKNMIDKD